jgi:hypothetical protein
MMDEIKHCKCGNEYTSYSEVLSLSRNDEPGEYLYTIRCPFCKKAARGGGPDIATARKLAVNEWNRLMEEVKE